jgi:hypothetical protein
MDPYLRAERAAAGVSLSPIAVTAVFTVVFPWITLVLLELFTVFFTEFSG